MGSKFFSHVTLAFNGLLYGSIAIFRLCRFVGRNIAVEAFTASANSLDPFCKAWASTASCRAANIIVLFYSQVLSVVLAGAVETGVEVIALETRSKCFHSISTAGYMRWFFCFCCNLISRCVTTAVSIS